MATSEGRGMPGLILRSIPEIPLGMGSKAAPNEPTGDITEHKVATPSSKSPSWNKSLPPQMFADMRNESELIWQERK